MMSQEQWRMAAASLMDKLVELQPDWVGGIASTWLCADRLDKQGALTVRITTPDLVKTEAVRPDLEGVVRNMIKVDELDII